MRTTLVLIVALWSSQAAAGMFDGFYSPEQRQQAQMDRIEEQQRELMYQQHQPQPQQFQPSFNYGTVTGPNGQHFNCQTWQFSPTMSSTTCQ
jgi:hypothetical protein